MAQITYADKVKIDDDPTLPAVNKVRDVDMNEIKEVVNENYTELDGRVSSLEDETWNLLLNKTTAGTYAVENLNNFKELLFIYSFASVQCFDSKVIPVSFWLRSNVFVKLKDAYNNQHALISYSNATNITLYENSNSDWHVMIYGR